jgi:hypothetical protein
VKLAVVVGAAMLVAFPVAAQRIPPRPDGVRNDNNNAGAIRLASSVGAAGLGIIAGGFLGYHLIPHCTGCEDPGLDAIVYGSFVGAAIGAAFGAARPNLHSVCPFRTRFQRTLIGAGVGAGAMFILGGGLSQNETSLILVPAGGIGGALAGLGRCWKSS